MMMNNMFRFFWNSLTYFSPLIISWLVWQFTNLNDHIKFSDTNFTISWSIATLLAGFILSNLPQDNKWVLKIKEFPGLFIRMSLFLMSPTIYGLTHYVLVQSIKPSEFLNRFIFISYMATITSIAITVFFLGIIAYKLHED